MYNDMAQLWVRSSPGRAPPWHGGGSEFDPRRIHHKYPLPQIQDNKDLGVKYKPYKRLKC